MRLESAGSAGEAFAIFFVLFMIFISLVIVVAVYVIKSIIYGKVFEKAGRDKKLGWIPFYREYILTEISGLNWYWILVIYAPTLLSLLTCWIPFVGLFTTLVCGILAKIGRINLFYNFNKKFKCEDIYIILYILLPELIPLGMMGFGKYEYDAKVPVMPDGFLGDLGFIQKNNNTTYEQSKEEEVVKSEIIKEEEVKVSKEEVKETKKEVVKEASDIEEKPKKKKTTSTKKKTTKKTEEKKDE